MIYLDNSATTNPKPPSVIRSAYNSLLHLSFNSGRGGYKKSVDTANSIYDVREKIAGLVNSSAERVVFTQNCTLALNMAIKGSVKRDEHIVISPLEHNAVARPVFSLAKQGIITYDVADFSFDKEEQIKNFKKLIKPNTTLIVCTMASNVFGVTMPVREIGAIAKKEGITFVVDAAQGLGIFPVDMKKDNIDILCGAGHKGLYGPIAEGFMVINCDKLPNPIIEGGTGSFSANLEQPDFLPDCFESGSLNNSLISGLGAGIDFVNSKGIDRIYSHELELIQMIFNELEKNEDVSLYIPNIKKGQAPIISFNLKDYSSEKTASLLAEKGISVRGGLHCAPTAHQCFNTINRGAVRISPSVYTSNRECEIFINSLKKL